MGVGLLVLFGAGLVFWSIFPSCFNQYATLVGTVGLFTLLVASFIWTRGYALVLIPVIALIASLLLFAAILVAKKMFGLQCEMQNLFYSLLLVVITSVIVSFYLSMKIIVLTDIASETMKKTTTIASDTYPSEIIELDQMSRTHPAIHTYMDKVVSMGRLPVLGEVIASRSWGKTSEAREIQERWTNNHA